MTALSPPPLRGTGMLSLLLLLKDYWRGKKKKKKVKGERRLKMFFLFGKSFIRTRGKGFASPEQVSVACPSPSAPTALLLISWARAQ